MVEYRLKNLHDLAYELEKAYSTQTNPPLLYSGCGTELGHHGVVMWKEDGVACELHTK